ncbi:MAG: hypothetical protein HOQ05_14130 [Corynebacteriales bacterium]|nr:hypothetical protein [Mycobacteriales bacterium]
MPEETWPKSRLARAKDSERFVPVIRKFFHASWSGLRIDDMAPELGEELAGFQTWLPKAIADGTLNEEIVSEQTNYSPKHAKKVLEDVWAAAFSNMEQAPEFPTTYDPKKGVRAEPLSTVPGQTRGGPHGPPAIGPQQPGPSTPPGSAPGGPRPPFPGPRRS